MDHCVRHFSEVLNKMFELFQISLDESLEFLFYLQKINEVAPWSKGIAQYPIQIYNVLQDDQNFEVILLVSRIVPLS